MTRGGYKAQEEDRGKRSGISITLLTRNVPGAALMIKREGDEHQHQMMTAEGNKGESGMGCDQIHTDMKMATWKNWTSLTRKCVTQRNLNNSTTKSIVILVWVSF